MRMQPGKLRKLDESLYPVHAVGLCDLHVSCYLHELYGRILAEWWNLQGDMRGRGAVYACM